MSERQQSWLRIAILLAFACMVVAALLLYRNWGEVHTALRTYLSRPGEPVYQWAESETRTLDFLPGEGKGWGPIQPQQGEIRYNVAAAMPVDAGLMDEAKWSNRMDAWLSMRSSSTCFKSNIRKSVSTCRMRTGRSQLVFVRDLRPKQAGMGFKDLFGTRGPIQEPNSVTITILTRKCVANCEYALK